MNHLDNLESEAIEIIREAKVSLEKVGLLWSLGKDSGVLIRLAQKAFGGKLPFRVFHLDTGAEFPEAYAFRDHYTKAWGLDLVADICPPLEDADPTLPAGARFASRKSLGLAAAIKKYQLDGLIAGIRRDEQSVRAKERIFSPRRADGSWNIHDQPSEFWQIRVPPVPEGGHIRIHPLLSWTELDVWHYIEREEIPVVSLYFAKNGERFRSLGEVGITVPIKSQAATVGEIIKELAATKTPERAGRTFDAESEDVFERLRAGGYL